ncbi:MotA/TolQ/ExbB proton channel family protein [candidate division KSB1 bacterium]|nr:MotA/TolQ/ExbB proton channel family protein [candidate division KSB1 bacterium]
MIGFIQSGGAYMWLLLIIAIVILILTVTKGIQLYGKKENKRQLENGVNAILFWGAFSLVLGFFAHFHGVYMAMGAIQAANDISPAIVAGGYAVSLITILTGLLLFMFSSIVWFFYRTRLAKSGN